MEIKVSMPEFEGPLDLLLHLIKQTDIDICDISIEVITRQYLDYINKMGELNLNVASEYLVMAAELMEIKSRMLLPKHDDIDDEYEEDPREQLINRLLEYERYKNVTESLKDYEASRMEMYSKIPSDLSDYSVLNDAITDDFNMDDLVNAFMSLRLRKELDKPISTKITSKEYPVSERSNEIRRILKSCGRMEFVDLFEDFSKEYLVVTFLSILDLAKKRELVISQDVNFNKIFIESKGM